MLQYKDILNDIINGPSGLEKDTRTGVKTRSISGMQFAHDIRNGFPLLTTKKMSIKNIAVELEFFIKGLSDKKWLQERGCHIWDEWANPKKVENSLRVFELKEDEYKNTPRDGRLFSNTNMTKDEFRKVLQKSESDLGRIYGVQWRDWKTSAIISIPTIDKNEKVTPGKHMLRYHDQLIDVIERAKKNPLDRRLLVTAWRPDELDQMALPPCHYAWQILSDGDYLDLIWVQRSVDVGLGLPYNIASYGLLLLLLAKELDLTPRRLVGQLGDTHIYENHFDKLLEQMGRECKDLPIITIPDEGWNGILNWEYWQYKLNNYEHHPAIKLEIAV